MNATQHARSVFTFAILGLSLTLGVGTAFAGTSNDGWITTKTKISLLTTSHIPSNAVHVDTIDGRVTLYGKVATQAQKEDAESVAKKVDGVREVRNMLQVVPTSEEKAVAASDDQIKDRVKKEIKDDPRLADSSVTVKSVDKGVVLLAGKANNLTDLLAALECANMVPGVRHVKNEIEYANTVDDVEPSRAAKKGSDSWITLSTKMRLITDRNVPALDVGVDTDRGVVTLFGVVPTAMAKEAAEADARKVDSVRNVRNELQVVATSKREMVDSKDEVVTRDVKSALKTRPELKHVDVTVKNGVVRLTGNVPSGWERLEAATVVRSTKGVRGIEDDLKP